MKAISQERSHLMELNRDIWRITKWAFVPLLILLVPLIATLVTYEVQWDVADLAFAGAILTTAGVIYAASTPKGKTSTFRFVNGLVIIIVVVLIWIEFAVGIFP